MVNGNGNVRVCCSFSLACLTRTHPEGSCFTARLSPRCCGSSRSRMASLYISTTLSRSRNCTPAPSPFDCSAAMPSDSCWMARGTTPCWSGSARLPMSVCVLPLRSHACREGR